MATWRTFADRMLNSHRSVASRFRYSSGGVGCRFPSSIQSSPSFLPHLHFLGKPPTLSPVRRTFSALQAATVYEDALPTECTPLRSSSPYLMVPPGLVPDGENYKLIPEAEVEPNEKEFHHLFNVAEKKLIKIPKNNLMLQWRREVFFPTDEDALCVGSSHGWLAFINQRNCAIYLFNPLFQYHPHSVSFPLIPLPPIETLPSVISSFRRRQSTTEGSSSSSSSSVVTEYTCRERISPVSSKELSSLFIKEIVFSSSPSNPDCTVMAIQGYEEYHLAFCRIGDTSWTPLDFPNSYGELVYFSKHQLFYAMYGHGTIVSWDLRDPAYPKRSIVITCLPPIEQPFMDEHQRWVRTDHHSNACYLVESSGDLLMVVRYYSFKVDDNGNIIPGRVDYSIQPHKTLQFDVYKLDFNQKKWVYVPNLGDRILFVGINHCVSLSARDFPGLRGNSIYFTCLCTELMEDSYGGHDVGVFNLEDNTITPFYQCDFKKLRQPPIWIIPQL